MTDIPTVAPNCQWYPENGIGTRLSTPKDLIERIVNSNADLLEPAFLGQEYTNKTRRDRTRVGICELG